MTYRQLHKRQQEGEFPNVGNSPFGFDWHDLPSLARQSPDVEVIPEQQQQQQQQQQEKQDSEGRNSNNQEQQQQDGDSSEGDEDGDGTETGTGDDGDSHLAGRGSVGESDSDDGESPGEDGESPSGESDGTGEDDSGEGGIDAIPGADSVGDMADDEDVPDNLQPMGQVDGEAGSEEDGKELFDVLKSGDVGVVPNVGNYGGFFHGEVKEASPDDATRLMKRALSKLSGGFATKMTPLWDYAKLIRRVATRQDYNLAKKEQDGNPTVLFIGDMSGSCRSMVRETKRILMAATKMGVRGSDVWLLLSSNGEFEWFQQGAPELYHNGKQVDAPAKGIFDYIKPQVIINVGDEDSLRLMFYLQELGIKTLHVYANNYGNNGYDYYYLGYPKYASTNIHPDVGMARIATSKRPVNRVINIALIGGSNKWHSGQLENWGNVPPEWRIAYAVDFFCAPEKMAQIPLYTSKYV